MMGFNGGLLGVQRRPIDGYASGMWFPNEQALASLNQTWPRVGPYRYYRLSNFANTSLNTDTIDFGEIELYFGDTKYTGITATTNFTWTAGASSALTDGVISVSPRAYRTGWSSIRSTATITLDLGSPKGVSHIKIFSLYDQPRFPASFVFSGSADNSIFTTIATVTVGTSFTLVSTSVFSSAKVAII